MTSATHDELADHLLRPDGQEDICLSLYAPSTGAVRDTAVLTNVVLPEHGDRQVHGNATITSAYVLRAAAMASKAGLGVAIHHSHPGGRGWQTMSGPDRDAEEAYANLVREVTGHPLVGMTLAGGDHGWSARHWSRGVGRGVSEVDCENVRIVGDTLTITWNDRVVPPPTTTSRLTRTVSAWGDKVQADLARRRVLIVGAGSVGLDLILRLAASGVTRITIMDFDIVKVHNLDRLVGAGILDAVLRRPKIDVARREALRAATGSPEIAALPLSICESQALTAALDHDIILCAVDRPWARAILNGLAFSDLIPVIDGGIAIDTMPTGGMRNATWRSHVIRPGRPCMACTRQIDGAAVSADIQGLLDDPGYIAGLDDDERQRLLAAGANVAPLSIGAAAAILAQYVSYSIGPGGLGDPGPLRYILSSHHLERVTAAPHPDCTYEAQLTVGDQRLDLTGDHAHAEAVRREASLVSWPAKIGAWMQNRLEDARERIRWWSASLFRR